MSAELTVYIQYPSKRVVTDGRQLERSIAVILARWERLYLIGVVDDGAQPLRAFGIEFKDGRFARK